MLDPGNSAKQVRGLAAHLRIVAFLGKQPFVEAEGFLQHGLPSTVMPRLLQLLLPQLLQTARVIADQLQMVLGPLCFLIRDVPFSAVVCGILAGTPPLPEYPGAADQKDKQERGQHARNHRVAAAPDDDLLANPNWAS